MQPFACLLCFISKLIYKIKMKKCLVYIHGKGGSAQEAEHYKPLFESFEIIGFEYQAQMPWEAKDEFAYFFAELTSKYEKIVIVANSIGAFFAMHSLENFKISEAYFISPIVNMEHLIKNMMQWANLSETELQQKGTIQTEFGETLDWEYLKWVRENPINWSVPTHILYGCHDNLQSMTDIESFAFKIGADITVMKNGEHWFHTEEQMRFLDDWIKSK